MLDLFNRSQPRRPSAALAGALASDDLTPEMASSSLLVVAQRGSYAGRHVTYFRVFDPVRMGEQSVREQPFADLNPRPELVLASGHLERDDTVVMPRPGRAESAGSFIRSGADRAARAGDQQFVFQTPTPAKRSLDA